MQGGGKDRLRRGEKIGMLSGGEPSRKKKGQPVAGSEANAKQEMCPHPLPRVIRFTAGKGGALAGPHVLGCCQGDQAGAWCPSPLGMYLAGRLRAGAAQTLRTHLCSE